MLYSHNGAYPAPLPNRIILSDGRSRTDPSTFTKEEIDDAGYVWVEEKPTVLEPHFVTWTGTSWAINVRPLSQYKIMIKQEVTKKRYQIETNHPVLDTSRQSQAMVNSAWSAVQLNPSLIIDFKQKDGSWVQLDKTAVEAIAAQVVNHVQMCFSKEKELHTLIDSATTHEEINAIDIVDCWDFYEL
jgi:hypothetical protein